MKVSKINNINNFTNSAFNGNVVNKNEKKQEYNQINKLSNVCYKPLSFGRSMAEHKSWGAVIDPKTKDVSFKLFTYPDTKRVTVTVERCGREYQKKEYELENKGNGIFETPNKISHREIKTADNYYYTIYKGNGDIDKVKDPYSYWQEKLLGESKLYDHSKYKWSDSDWFKTNKSRISRRANQQNGLTPLNEAKIYELNIPTFTKEGRFESAMKKLDGIKKLGFNSIEIMPVENTYSFNWGYDGVDKMAPNQFSGEPDSLKSLIDYAHHVGLNVIMDMVPNHLGPDGASLAKTGPYIKGQNCFGEAFNYEGANSRYVRDFIVNAALNWLDNYHCDGLRLDMTKFMDSDYTMKQIAAEVNYHKPDAFLIAEDARSGINVSADGKFWDDYNEPHDKRVTNPLLQFESGEGLDENSHINAIEQISGGNTSLGRLGYDSEWDFNYFHTLKDSLYGIIDLNRIEKAIYCSQDRVKYVMSHDEIGNLEGTRLIAKLMEPMLHISENTVLNDKDKQRAELLSEMRNSSIQGEEEMVKNQKAEFNSEKLAMMLQTGKLEKYNPNNPCNYGKDVNKINELFQKNVLVPLGIKKESGLNYTLVNTMFNKSLAKNRMAMALTYSIPGPIMVFQGDEKADLTPFRFFRKFQSRKNEPELFLEKGYNTGLKGYKESILDGIDYSSEGLNSMNKFENLIKDLNKIKDENPAMTKGKIIPEDTVKHDFSQVLALHTRDENSNNDIFTITNFNDSEYPRFDATSYYIKFPKGKWIEVLNTDNENYSSGGNFNNSNPIISDGINNNPVKLAGLSTYIFKKVD